MQKCNLSYWDYFDVTTKVWNLLNHLYLTELLPRWRFVIFFFFGEI